MLEVQRKYAMRILIPRVPCQSNARTVEGAFLGVVLLAVCTSDAKLRIVSAEGIDGWRMGGVVIILQS